MNDPITVETFVNVPVERAWRDFTTPEAILAWNAASGDWHTTKAENDLRPGGSFMYRMEAKDGSEGFDFGGVYDEVVEHARFTYTMSDGRKVEVAFVQEGEGTRVTTVFEPETENTRELQQSGWQSILESFKKYSERAS